MKQFSEGIPGEMLEAARIDGASEAKTFVRIALPMIKPGIGALAIFTFINSWNDYFMQSIMLSSTSKLTISLGIAKPAGRELHRLRPDHGRCRAGSRAHHHRVPGLPEVLHEGHHDGRCQGLKTQNGVLWRGSLPQSLRLQPPRRGREPCHCPKPTPTPAFPLGEGVCGPDHRRMRGGLPEIARKRAVSAGSALISHLR